MLGIYFSKIVFSFSLYGLLNFDISSLYLYKIMQKSSPLFGYLCRITYFCTVERIKIHRNEDKEQ